MGPFKLEKNPDGSANDDCSCKRLQETMSIMGVERNAYLLLYHIWNMNLICMSIPSL